jgi:predicted RNase H-like HicB family nuclease
MSPSRKLLHYWQLSNVRDKLSERSGKNLTAAVGSEFTLSRLFGTDALTARLTLGVRRQETVGKLMKLKVIIHEAEEGGFWAEVPAIPGCMTQGETIKELIENLYDAVEGCLSVDMDKIALERTDTVMELAV